MSPRLRAGIDLDGVLADTGPIWSGVYRHNSLAHGHPPVPEYRTQTDYDHWQTTCPACFRLCLTSPALQLLYPPLWGARAALALLAPSLDLVVVSARPPELGEVTFRWLHTRGLLPFFQDVILTTDKRETCERLGLSFLLDDAPHQLAALSDSPTVAPLAFAAPYNAQGTGPRLDGWASVAAFFAAAHVEVTERAVAAQQGAQLYGQLKAAGALPTQLSG